MSNAKYSCNECANTRTLLCSQCTRISSPNGRERMPKLFLRADGDGSPGLAGGISYKELMEGDVS